VYDRTPENLQRLAEALAPCQPYLRGAPAGLLFCLSAATLSAGLNFTLTTTLGDIDLFGEVAGGGPTRTSCTTASYCDFPASNAAASPSSV
jgi:hypothetical protein